MQLSKNAPNYIRFILNVQKLAQKCVMPAPYTTSVDALDLFTSELLHRHRKRGRISHFGSKDFNLNIRFFTEIENKDVSQMTMEQLDTSIQELLSKNKDKQIQQIIQDCLHYRKYLPITTLKKLFRNYSIMGKPESVMALQNYCAQVDPILNKRNVLGSLTKYSLKSFWKLQKVFKRLLRTIKNRDMRGCAEILRNCKVLGVSLPLNQQGKFIQLLIDGKELKPTGKPPIDFKLKF
ncbi:hypothetical protein MSG28_008704 [Choristoneura fumiferana]|uniref:Uncharacterized protein n=1 Tax=Choristoneura fumiferana TaxID=7141 RepID=A0ACC0J7N4_CHOFU|nr:hypothetical protein MSG28_008704 [Choristoneura fumiferana]